MSITATTAKTGPYVMAAFPQVCASGFPFQQAADLKVINAGSASAPRDPPVVLTLGSDYTVSGGGYIPSNQMQTGNVTVLSGGVNLNLVGDLIYILRNVPVNQIDSATSANLSTIIIEEALDKQATISQQITDKLSRALAFEDNESLNATLVLANRKNSILGFDNSGNISFLPTSSTTGSVQLPAVATITALKGVSVTGLASNASIQVLGYSSSGDGGGGYFYYNSASAAVDNGGTIIAPTSGSGRWFRIFSGPINVRYFGAKGDGSSNDTSSIQSAINFVSSSSFGGAVYFPTGTYVVTSSLSMTSENKYIKLFGDMYYASTILGVFATTQPIISLGTANYEADSISFEDLHFQISAGGAGAFGASTYGVATTNRGGVYYRRCLFSGGYGGINMISKGWAAHVENCQFNGSRNSAILTAAADKSANGIVVTGCAFFQPGVTNSVAAMSLLGGDGISIINCDFEAVYQNVNFSACTGINFSFNYCDGASNKHFLFSGTNQQLNCMSNYLGVAPSTSFDSVAGLIFEANSCFNASFTFPSTSSKIRIGTNYLLGTSALDTPENSFSGAAPSQYILDQSGSSKSLRMFVASNYAQFLERLDASGTGVSIDLANRRLGVGVFPTAKLEVAGDFAISDTKIMKTNTSFTNGAGASAGTLTNAPSAGNPTKWIPINDNGTTRYIPAW